MIEIIIHLIVGLIVSFLGSIPLGTVNIIVVQTSLQKGFQSAMRLATGAIIVESLYSFLAVKAVFWMVNAADIERYIQWFALPLFVSFTIYFLLVKKNNPPKEDEDIQKEVKVIKNGNKDFLAGMLVGFVNPLGIPFWMTWSMYLHSQGWLKNEDYLVGIFLIGIAMGTFGIMYLYALMAKKLVVRFKGINNSSDKITGYVFLILSFYQGFKIFSEMF